MVYKDSSIISIVGHFCVILLGICIPDVYELKGIPQRESKSMRRRRIFSLLQCGQSSGTVHGSLMAIDSSANDWFLTSKARQ